jgi:hypothetical protein
LSHVRECLRLVIFFCPYIGVIPQSFNCLAGKTANNKRLYAGAKSEPVERFSLFVAKQ